MYAIWQHSAHWLAYGFGTGLVPPEPGTLGAAVGVALFWLMARLRPLAYAGMTAVLFLAGVFICGQTARDIGIVDPGRIVFDEMIGVVATLYLLPRRWPWILAGFVMFRILDGWKPWPIHLAEEIPATGTAIMADDLAAGLIAFLVLQLARRLLRKPSA